MALPLLLFLSLSHLSLPSHSATPNNNTSPSTTTKTHALDSTRSCKTPSLTSRSPPPPSVVSGTDILAVAACDLLTMMGGPYYNVLLGHRDGFISKSTLVEGNLPRPTMSMTQIINIFSSIGFSIEDMVALSGAHTIGFSHCKEFSTNIYNYTMKAT
ncbi:hypothetical protein ACSBR2_019349 [Camellia fascicularis]